MTISNDTQPLRALVEEQLAGTYFGVTPRNSFFFVPTRAIRAAITGAYPGFQAVSIVHDGFTGLVLSLHERVPVARWCGSSPSPQAVITDGEYCYLFDAGGYIYTASDVASTAQTLNSFAVYDPLAGGTEEPLRATLAHAAQLPNLFDLARKVASLGSPVETITIRDDETDLLLTSGTRITYVLGGEEPAFANLMSAKNNLNLSDGSLLYVDLRFPGKVYLKRRGGSVTE